MIVSKTRMGQTKYTKFMTLPVSVPPSDRLSYKMPLRRTGETSFTHAAKLPNEDSA